MIKYIAGQILIVAMWLAFGFMVGAEIALAV